MANYDMYMPNYSYHPQTITSQPVNGLHKVKSYEEVVAIPLAPNSVSEPFMLESDNIFFVKTTDEFSNPTVKAYRFEEINIPSPEDNSLISVFLMVPPVKAVTGIAYIRASLTRFARRCRMLLLKSASVFVANSCLW